MALPAQLQYSIMPDELEFIATEELINVVPSFSMGKIRFLSVSTSTRRSFSQ